MCTRLSRPGLLRGLRPAPAPSADDGPARSARLDGQTGRDRPGWFPRSPSPIDRVRCPAIPRQHRHGYAAGIHRGLPASDLTGRRVPRSPMTERVRTATQPISARFELAGRLEGRSALVPLVHLPVSLAGPAPSGSTSTSRRCRGCFRPPRRSPGQAALSFTALLRQPGGGGPFTSARFNMAPRGAHVAFPVPRHGPVGGFGGRSKMLTMPRILPCPFITIRPCGRRRARPQRRQRNSSLRNAPLACTNNDR